MRSLHSLVLLALVACAHAADPVRHDVLADGHPLALWEKSPESPRATVLLVHGRTWSALPNFDLQVPGTKRSVMEGFVAAGYATYALDLRGYGSSARDASGWLTPERAAEDVRLTLAWIRRAHPTVKVLPALVGYSRGSSVALLVAQAHPEAISSLVLYGFPAVSAPAQPPSPEPRREATTASAAASDFITPGAAPQAVIDAYVRRALQSDPIRSDWRNEEQFAFDATRVHVPTLLIYGANDPRYGSEQLSTFFRNLGTPDRALVLLPKSDHAAHVEDSQSAWLHAILAFIGQPRG